MEDCLAVTFFVLASYETDLLFETVSEIKDKCPPENLDKIIVVVKSDKCPSYLAMTNYIKNDLLKDVELYVQKSNNISDTLAELPSLVSGTHFVFIAADKEMNTDTIPDFIRMAKIRPSAIIAASKWKKESIVEGYGIFPEICAKAMNTLACLLIRRKATDLFTIYQLYPVKVYHSMNFNNSKSFGYEYTLKPVRFGIEYIEIPTVYKKTYGSKSNYNFLYRAVFLFDFLFTALRIGLTPKKYLLDNK